MSAKTCTVIGYDSNDVPFIPLRLTMADEKLSKKEAQRMATELVKKGEAKRAEVLSVIMDVA